MIWVTFLVEWVLIPAFGFIFLSQRGKVTRAFSIFFFILALPLTFTPQYFLLESSGVLTELKFSPYPTPIIQILAAIHLALIALATEFLFADLDRDPLGRRIVKPKQ